jgi:hypothetical protein
VEIRCAVGPNFVDPRTTDGDGGQGIKPLPYIYDGWVQDTVARTAQTDAEVQGWIAQLTPCQRNPAGPNCARPPDPACSTRTQAGPPCLGGPASTLGGSVALVL